MILVGLWSHLLAAALFAALAISRAVQNRTRHPHPVHPRPAVSARTVRSEPKPTDRSAIPDRSPSGFDLTPPDASERERLEALGVRVADASEFTGGLVNHDLFLSNADVQQVVRRAIERAGS